jgi:hypothetical protein
MPSASVNPAYPYRQSTNPSGRGKSFTFIGKLQIAGILLIIVFILCLVSAVVISMFEIHILALTEFSDDGKSDVYGYVTDENGENLVNATVSIHGTQHFAKTNPDGFFSMENVREGDYEIEASSSGYRSITKRISLNSNTPILVNFMLEEGSHDTTANARYESNLSELRYLNYSTAIFIMIFGSFALIGGILTLFERFYWFAMFGALCGFVAGVLSIGIVIGPALSTVALFLILVNHEEFSKSERPIVDRLSGIGRAQPRVSSVSKASPRKMQSYPAAPKASAEKMASGYGETPYPPPPPPMEARGPAPPPPPGLGGPVLTCIACKGTIRSESHGIVCTCGVWYHRFCAVSTNSCRRCGAPL